MYDLRTEKEWGSSLFPSTDGYFFSRARRTELYGSTGTQSLPPPSTEREAIEREIQKRQIREEILAREGRRRALEEEVMREMEMERMMALRRFQKERWSAGADEMVMHGHRAMQFRMPFFLESGGGVPLGRGLVNDAPMVAFQERATSGMLQNKGGVDVGQPSLQHKRAGKTSISRKSGPPSPSNETVSSNRKLSGRRKKASGEPKPPEKQLGCALCKVTVPNEESLKEHTLGKRHRENEKHLASKKPKTGKSQSKKKAASKAGGPVGGEPAKASSDGKNQKMWCSLCKVKYTSQVVMESHLAGRKHRARELKTNGNVLKGKESVEKLGFGVGVEEAVEEEEDEGEEEAIKEEEPVSFEVATVAAAAADIAAEEI